MASSTTPSSKTQDNKQMSHVTRHTFSTVMSDAPVHLLSLKVMRVSVRMLYWHSFSLISLSLTETRAG